MQNTGFKLAVRVAFAWLALAGYSCAFAEPQPSDLTKHLRIEAVGQAARIVDLTTAMAELHVPSLGIALLDRGNIVWTHTFGEGAGGAPLYQAASISKFVTAVVALKLVEHGVLSLDGPVDAKLTSWKTARSPFTDGNPVTLRWLLSMRAGINVPGFIGYLPGAPLPSLADILNGAPPANSPPVEVVARPGLSYSYSGGGYEIIEALIGDFTARPFAEVAQQLVLEPLGMADSSFSQPLSQSLTPRALAGHSSDGKPLLGGWRIMPELAAAGLWSTPNDLALLLKAVADGYHHRGGAILAKRTLEEMFTQQGGGPYGLGAAMAGTGRDTVLEKRGQNIGYQGYLILFPAPGQGMVVLTNSDNGSILADALIRRAAEVYGWPRLDRLAD